MIHRAGGWGPDGRRERIVDVGFVLLAATAGVLLFLVDVATDPSVTLGRVVLDLLLGLTASALLWLRRNRPVEIALLTLPATVLAISGGPATAIILFTVATRRTLPVAAAVAALQVGAAFVRTVLDGTPWDTTVSAVIIVAVVDAGIVAWGQLRQARRERVTSLRERAERAEAEQHLRAEHARQAERARIAREMHDVLAHRITLVALHAGALEVQPDLPAGAVETARVIRGTARLALEELREVIGVLRDDSAPLPAPQAPQPGLVTIERLVSDSRGAGAGIRLTMDVDRMDAAPSALGRDAYRIVQEALTNVSKHARGAATEVELRGGPGHGLRVVVRNRMPLAPPPGAAPTPSLPGAGRGLVGLSERVAISGGTLTHGPDGAGDFVVDAHLVWSR